MNRFSTDGINYTMEECLAMFIGVDTILQPTDFVRELVETGSEGGFDTSYQCEKWRGTAWHKVEDDLPGWVGSSYRDFMNFAEIERPRHEIIRLMPQADYFSMKIKIE